ncbi:asparagine synthase (glutamine-hydrolyzing) [bacterium]|nr:asparagine synthase (glutamine-hydrolyzing) [bacterium]
MCGIAGFCNISNSQFSLDESFLHAMQQTIEHRGPDGYRTWSSQKHEVAFVHRRLSIVDLSDAGFQPMEDAEKTVVVCCNGEIYNHEVLRKELESYGHVYRSKSDTETIVHAYKQWGIDCTSKFEGMFFIVIFDQIKNELYLVRDRIGIKPVYFSLQGGVLSFASEIKALWQLPWIQKSINSTAVSHYLTYLVSPAPMTLYEEMYKLPSSFYVKVDTKRNVTFHEWYCPIVKTYDQKLLQDEQFCVQKIRTLLRSSIKKRMMSDVPFGVFLSGGIDSSLNVALMSEYTRQVKTFNVSFSDGPEYSEVQWARKVANHFKTDHHELVINEKDAFSFFEKMVYHQDEPIGDCVCVPLYYVSKLLKDSGVTVVQVGEGSDELFCGYNRYAQYLQLHPWLDISGRYMPSFLKKTASNVFSSCFPKRFDKRELVNNWARSRALFWGGAVVFPETLKHEMNLVTTQEKKDPIVEQIYSGFNQNADSHNVAEYHLKKLKKINPQADFLQSMIYLELKQRLPELLLMRVDKMTMATSVEGRVPFLDHKLVEFALQVPKSLKYKDGITKYILKKACEGILPNDVIYRKKMGFAAPATRWFKNGDYFKEHLLDMLSSKNNVWGDYVNFDAIKSLVHENKTCRTDYSYHLWALQNLIGCHAKK